MELCQGHIVSKPCGRRYFCDGHIVKATLLSLENQICNTNILFGSSHSRFQITMPTIIITNKFLFRYSLYRAPESDSYLFTTKVVRCTSPFSYLVLRNSFIILFPGTIASKLVSLFIPSCSFALFHYSQTL